MVAVALFCHICGGLSLLILKWLQLLSTSCDGQGGGFLLISQHGGLLISAAVIPVSLVSSAAHISVGLFTASLHLLLGIIHDRQVYNVDRP